MVSLHGVIDMHVHTEPDLRPRAYDDFALCDAAVRVGARAIVIKSHLGSTAERAFLCNRYVAQKYPDSGFTMLGSIVLNRCVGGINASAVENALLLGAKVVYLPTQSARNHLLRMGKDVQGAVDVLLGGEIVPELRDVFALVKAHGAVLATAHIAPVEAEVVVREARRAGISRIVVTHPEWWLVGMDIAMQRRMVEEYGAVLERCFAQNMGGGRYRSNLPQNVQVMRKLGCGHILASTDGGQIENPHWEEAMAETVAYLLEHGIAPEDVRHMTSALPAQLLGIRQAVDGGKKRDQRFTS